MTWFNDGDIDAGSHLLYKDCNLPRGYGIFVKNEGVWHLPLDSMHEEAVDDLLKRGAEIIDKSDLPAGRPNSIDVFMAELEKKNLDQDEFDRRVHEFCIENAKRRREER